MPAPAITPPLALRSRRRSLILGCIVALLASIAFFGGLELVLRVIGYGHSPKFYRVDVDAAGHRWIRANGWVTAPYFSPELMRRPQSFRLPATKAPNTYRVFVLGSSAAMGDPQPSFSVARMLDVMLREAYPAVHFEVVNAGITGINSHVVRSIARDCADLQPDLYIVYEGNNEVIGPYGPGTVFTPFLGSTTAIRIAQEVKSTRTGQLAASLLRSFDRRHDDLKYWGGMSMFLQHQIARDDPRLSQTQVAFRRNLRAITASGHDAGATVFLCTVITNEKDFAPFVSRHRPNLSSAERQRWDALFNSGEKAAAAGDDVAAEASFRSALAIDDTFAELTFQLGRLCLRQNRDAEAKVFLEQALDLDLLRFRTDSGLNAAIRSLANQVPAEIIDVAAAAERQSPHGIVGNNLLFEHVHLNFQGTYLFARELFPPIAADLARRKLVPVNAPLPEPVSAAEVGRRLAYTDYDRVLVIGDLRGRLSEPPFTGKSDNVNRLRELAEQETNLAAELSPLAARRAIARFYDEALAANPDDWVLNFNAGELYIKLGESARGLQLLARANAIVPDDLDTLFSLASVERKLGDTASADRHFTQLRQLEPRYIGLPPSPRAGR